MPRQADDDIPALLARRLHDRGLTWAQVGRTIASQRGRAAPYKEKSVSDAVRREARQAGNTMHRLPAQ